MRGIKYAISTYADAYAITFLSDERIIVSSSNRGRIKEYQDEVAEHLDQAVRISRSPCPDGEAVTRQIFFCPPDRPSPKPRR